MTGGLVAERTAGHTEQEQESNEVDLTLQQTSVLSLAGQSQSPAPGNFSECRILTERSRPLLGTR